MAELVLMPKLGFNMETGQIAKWHLKEGDVVHKGDVLVEILTDKTNMEIESTLSGTLRKILFEEGETVPVILPMAIVGDADENIAEITNEAMIALGKTPGPNGSLSESEPKVQNGPLGQKEKPINIAPSIKLKLSPRASKYVKDSDIDISNVEIKGTGFEGGITTGDIEAYVKNNSVKVTPLAEKIAAKNNIDAREIKGSGIGGKVSKADVENVINKDAKGMVQTDAFIERKIIRTVKYIGMRKVIGDRLSQSKFTAPHLYFTISVDVSNLMSLRQQINKSQEQKVSVNDFIIGAVTKALQKYPEINSSLQGDQIIQYEDVNMGIAVGLDSGLIVPVLPKAQNKRITQIAKESQFLIEKARNGKLLPDEYQGGTFTISNLGMFGIENFTAIINPPEAGILSISAVKKTPVVVENEGEDKVLIRPIMKTTLSVDHRIIDGMAATRFMNEIKELLEKPFNIII